MAPSGDGRAVIAANNSNVGDVDMLENFVANYRIALKGKIRWWPRGTSGGCMIFLIGQTSISPKKLGRPRTFIHSTNN
jgi:hypothetical protein